jgi:hypothetical protein
LELVKLSQVDGRILVLMYQLFLGRCRKIEGLELGGVDRSERLLGRGVESQVGRVDKRREIHGADVDHAGVQEQSSERCRCWKLLGLDRKSNAAPAVKLPLLWQLSRVGRAGREGAVHSRLTALQTKRV